MKHFAKFVILTSASLLVACASSLPKPEQYGFRRVAIKGQDYLCAPTKWVVPPVTAPAWLSANASAGYIPSGLFGPAYPTTDLTCITPAQWPDWLMLRNTLSRQWPITAREAQALATR